MARPARQVLIVVAALSGAGMAWAQEAVSPLEEGSDKLKTERAISSRTARMITASLPTYAPKDAEGAEPARVSGIPRVVDRPANGIVRLPDYIVREPKLPNAEQVLSRRGLADYAMKKYLGPSDGFDRGVLNVITFRDLAKKVPVLGFLFGLIPSISNEDRALMYYYQDKRLEEMKYLSELAAMPGPNGMPAKNDKTQREIQKTFMHASELGR